MVPLHRCFVSSTNPAESTNATNSTSVDRARSRAGAHHSGSDMMDSAQDSEPCGPPLRPDKGVDHPSHDHDKAQTVGDRAPVDAHAADPTLQHSSNMVPDRVGASSDTASKEEVSAATSNPPGRHENGAETSTVALDDVLDADRLAEAPSTPAIAEGGSAATAAAIAARLGRRAATPERHTAGPLDASSVVNDLVRPRRSPPIERARHGPQLHRSSSAQNIPSLARSSSQDVVRASTPTASSSTHPARFVDPDSHWLSEDEGASQQRHRRPRRRNRSSSFSAQPGSDDTLEDRRKQGEDGLLPRANLSRHAIHHRPAGIAPPTDAVETENAEDAAVQAITPVLLHRLTCKACGFLLKDPTTLSCGHTVCLSCDSNTSEEPVVSSNGISISRLHGLPARESQFTRNPDQPIRGAHQPITVVPTGMVRTESTGTVSSIGKRSRISCPYPNCSKKDRSVLTEHRVDFVLQKLLDVIRQDIPGVDSAVARSKAARDEFAASEDQTEIIAFSVRRASGSSSCDSDPVEGDDHKRTHSRRAANTSAKRVRRRELPPGSKEDPVPGPAEFLDLTNLPKTFLGDLQSELECQVCVQLFLDPLTAPCGHTFCQKCLQRALDHSDKCPLCRSDFPSFTYILTTPTNHTTQAILLSAFGKLSAERREAAEAESRSAALDTPVFVCTLAWPSLPTYIHVFEPRYRLMIRRALETDRQFGMVLPDRSNGGVHEYGTMLHINSCNLTDDGRSILETVGTYRFRVLEKGTFDGYTVARIERIDDIAPEQEAELERIALARNAIAGPDAQKELSTAELMQVCLGFIETLRTGSAPWVLQRLNNTIGPMPTNPADFSFWMAEVMPVDDHLKASLLQITSPRERLRLIVFWIEQFRSSWWFSRGCSLM